MGDELLVVGAWNVLGAVIWFAWSRAVREPFAENYLIACAFWNAALAIIARIIASVS